MKEKIKSIKNKFLILGIALLILLSGVFLLSACGGNKNYSVSMTIDGQYLYLDMFGSGNISFKKDDIKTSGLTLYGYDVYDYSELKVLINGKEDSELFQKNNNSGSTHSNQIRGDEIQIGTFILSNINEDVKITITGAKEKEVSLAFMRADDERLGNKILTPENPAIFDRNYNDYINNYSTKLKEKDYEYFGTYYPDENIASVTNDDGYTSVDWLFKDDKNVILYEDEENEDNNVYKPYEFKYNASEFFNKYLVTYYSYITPDGIFTGTSDGSPMENLPSGTKEFKYQKYVFTNGILNTYNYYDTLAIFEILSDKKYGYYKGVKIKNYEYNFENYNSYDGVLTNDGKDVEDVYKPLNKDNITVEQLRKQSNYVFELYEKNLFVFNFSNMNVKEKDILINYSDGQNICSVYASLSSAYSDGIFGNLGTSLDDIGGVDDKSTFYITNLPNKIEGVSDIDFSKAEIYINGTKLEPEGDLAGYKYVPADTETGVEEYFECYISADVVGIDFYSKERLLDNDLSLDNDNNEKFVITIKNIIFDNAVGLSKIKVTDNTQSNIPSIYSETSYETSSNAVYSWNEGNTVYAYVQTENYEVPNKISVYFNPQGGWLNTAKTPKISIKKGGDIIKEIDIMAQINKGLEDDTSLKDFSNVVDDSNHRHISWSEDGYEIKVSFYQSEEINIQSLSTINIKLQLDRTDTDWLEMNCEFI